MCMNFAMICAKATPLVCSFEPLDNLAENFMQSRISFFSCFRKSKILSCLPLEQLLRPFTSVIEWRMVELLFLVSYHILLPFFTSNSPFLRFIWRKDNQHSWTRTPADNAHKGAWRPHPPKPPHLLQGRSSGNYHGQVDRVDHGSFRADEATPHGRMRSPVDKAHEPEPPHRLQGRSSDNYPGQANWVDGESFRVDEATGALMACSVRLAGTGRPIPHGRSRLYAWHGPPTTTSNPSTDIKTQCSFW